MKKTISSILALVLLLTALSGCAQPSPAPTATPEPAPSEQKVDINGFNSDLYKPDTLMFKVDGSPVYWTEYLYWVAADIYYIYQTSGVYPTNWDEKISDTMTVKDYILGSAKNAITMYRTVEKKAADMGIKLNDDDKAEIKKDIQTGITYYETEEAYENYLKSSYLSMDLYRYMLSTAILYKKVFTDIYGEGAKKFSDTDTLSFANKQGYIKAKHIFMPSSTEEDKDKEAKDKMQVLLNQLKAALSEKERVALFDKLMKEFSKDEGLSLYPDGYVFKDGDMDMQFQSTAEALSANTFSEVIKSGFGYHIILRLPLAANDRVFSSEGASGDGTDTLRYYGAYDTYQKIVDGWVKEAKLEEADALKNFDLSKIYK